MKASRTLLPTLAIAVVTRYALPGVAQALPGPATLPAPDHPAGPLSNGKPKEGDVVPPPTPRDPALGMSGPGARHTARWLSYPSRLNNSAVKNGLIPDIKPLIPDTQLRDTIIILGGDGNYYMTGSSGDNIWDFNTGIELWKSADLQHWDYLGFVWTFDKDGTWERDWRWHHNAVRAIWAPEIHYIKSLNNYFLTISMPPGNRGILKSSSGKPEGPYINALADDAHFPRGIDGTLFEDDDGKIYFTSDGGGSISLMKPDLSGVDGEPHRIVVEGHNGSVAGEGASLFKANGLYYLGGARTVEGRYSSVCAISTTVFGPYHDYHEAVPCSGGTDYFQDKQGRWFCGFFGNDNAAPYREVPGMIQIDFDKTTHKIIVADEQPAFILKEGVPTHWRDNPTTRSGN